MPYTAVTIVEVVYKEQTVGATILDPRSGYYAFEYERAWLTQNIALSPLAMPNRRGPRVFPQLPIATYQRLPPMLADGLPDDFGNTLITAYLAREGVASSKITPLDRLAYLGARAMGALEFLPPTGPDTNDQTAFAMSKLVQEARKAVEGSFGTPEDATSGIHHLLQVGTSAGGARPKAVIALNDKTGEIRSGQVATPDGFEHWMLKFDGVGSDFELGDTGSYGRIEYAYHLMAIAAGIDMTECRLLEEGGRAHFMTRRFDRPLDGSKIHIQTLCAMAELDFRVRDVHDYAQFIGAANELDLGAGTREKVFRRAVFNIAVANCDDHTKNHAFALDDSGAWSLAPAYDVTHAHNPVGEWTSRHLMGVDGLFYDADRSHLLRFADRFEIPNPRLVIDEVNAAVGSWSEFAQKAGLPDVPTRHVANDLRKL
jgi:serine/threonine-protein kinase HipA